MFTCVPIMQKVKLFLILHNNLLIISKFPSQYFYSINYFNINQEYLFLLIIYKLNN